MPTTDGSQRTKRVVRPSRLVRSVKKPPKPGKPLRHELLFGRKTPAVFQTDAVGLKPAWFFGFETEWRVYWWLTVKEKLVEGRDFEFQSKLFGGRQILGGLVADFLLHDRFPPGLIINPIGYYWHRYSTQLRADDMLDRIRLMQRGYTVVNIHEQDLYDQLPRAMRAALVGQELDPWGLSVV